MKNNYLVKKLNIMDSTLPSLKLGAIIQVNMPPNNGDIAFTSINDLGTKGELNLYVLKEYGYYEEDLPKKKDLINGFALLHKDGLKPIIFIVTVNEQDTSSNLKQNLTKAIAKYKDRLIGKRIWIPLMGTGIGNLTIEESYRITINVINNFSIELSLKTTLLLSIPNTADGNSFFNNITNARLSLDIQRSKIQNFIQNFQYNFYLLEENNDINTLKKSYNTGLWERKAYSTTSMEIEIISKINIGDIIIVKSTHVAPNKTLFTKIKAIGRIKEILNNKKIFKIEWFEKKLSIDIESIDFLRSNLEIQEVSKNNAEELLLRIYNENPTIIEKILAISNKEKIAGLISDSDDGIDYLEIDKDVNAFAKVIAAKSFEPPLAVALFGKWGSGKSFFMNKLKTRITKLSEINNIYCKGVVQIHFNAWSYMDSNLWASIVTRIFEELNIYISENTHGENEKKIVEQELTSHLSITKEEINTLNNKKQIVKKEINLLKRRRKKIQEDLLKKISQIKKETIWDVIENVDKEFNAKERILKELNSNQSFSRIKDDIEKNIPEEYLNDPKKVYEIAKSRYTFFKEFFKKDKIVLNLVWLIGILTIIILFPLFLDLVIGKIKEKNFIIPQATLSIIVTLTAVWKRVENVYKDLKPLIASFWNIKEEYEKKVEEATTNYEKEKQVLIFEIKENKSKILIISEQIQNAERKKTDIEFRINNALATETLYSFIDRRSKSNDYQKHLGIISIIRKDFEILSDLFIGHHKEIYQNNSNNDFKSRFKKPLERIILYIDDLDRCPEENVVQVLEAVNLLMAFPLFVVVVGVDSRWVKNALHKKHFSQFDNSNELIEVLEVSNYLEKIFQIPFHLKDANDSSVKDMIKNLAQNTFEKSLQSVNESLAPALENISKKNKNSEEEITIDVNVGNSTDLNESKSITQPPTNNITEINFSMDIENLILTDIEIEIMQDMSEIIGNNPRCIKRFVNIFRIIKAHEEFGYSDDPSNQDIIVILFLIALPLGKYKKLVPSFENYIADTDNDYKSFNNYFRSNINVDTNIIILKREVDVVLSEKKTYSILQNMNCNIFKKHNNFIKRFTFSQI